jgi:hypothetical protein
MRANYIRLLTPGLLVFLSTLLVFAFSLNGIWAADHPTSLMQLSYALWADHSVVLGKAGHFQPGSVDDFVYKGNYYSALAPGVSFLALPFVGLGFILDGRFTVFGDAMLLSELFVALCNAVAAYIVFKLASMYFSEKTAIFVAFAYAFSTISWPFATYFFESDVAAMLDLLAVYFAVRMARSRSPSVAASIYCGAALGAALTMDYVNALLIPIVSLFLLYTFRKDLASFAKGFAGLLVTAAVGVGLLALYNQVAFGSPLVTTQQAYDNNSSLFGSFSYPILNGLYLDLFSPLRGVFVYCPILVLGAVGFYFLSKRPGMASEGLLLAACFIGALIPYSMWFDAAGGEAFGQRFLIPVIPFLLLPSGFALESRRRGLAALAYLLYGIGVVFNGIAGITTAIPQVEAVSHFPFLTHVLPLFLSGMLDTWWWKRAGSLWWAPSLLIIAAALVLPWAVARVARSDGGRAPEEARADRPELVAS